MGVLIRVTLSLFVLLLSVFSANADFNTDFGGGTGTPTVRYCDDGQCGLQEGITAIEDSLGGIETEDTASEYIQRVVLYLLSFLALIAVVYIIYAGFNIMIGNGDEEKLKKSRQTIFYVLLGLIVIFLAWPITLFILGIFN